MRRYVSGAKPFEKKVLGSRVEGQLKTEDIVHGVFLAFPLCTV